MRLWSSIKKLFHKNNNVQEPIPEDVQWSSPLDLESNQVALNYLNEENRGRDVDSMYDEILGRGISDEDMAAPARSAPVEEDAPVEEVAPAEEAAEDVEVEPAHDEAIAVPEEELGAGMSRSDKKRSSDAAVRLKGHSETLKETKKWGGNDNSDSYKRVMNRVDDAMNGITSANPLNDDMFGSTKTLIQSIKDYKGIIVACDDYIEKHPKPRSIPGKSRKKAILRIKEQALKDMQGLRDYSDTMSSLSENERAGSVRDVLTRSRRRVLKLKKKDDGTEMKESDLKHVGGNASSLAYINKGALDGEDTSGFFKEREVLTGSRQVRDHLTLVNLGVDSDRNFINTGHSLNIANQLKGDDKAYGYAMEINRVLGSAKRADSLETVFNGLKKDPRYESDELFKSLVDRNYDAYEKKNGLLMDYDVLEKNTGTVNLSDRNVASSRIANLLGIGDLVAQSETAELVSSDGSQRQVGNLMQQAPGKSLSDAYYKDFYGEDFQNGMAELGLTEDTVTKFNEDLFAKYNKKDISSSVTPEYMRSMINLQVFDTLVGQGDRHTENIFVNKGADGKFGKAMGIDNDYSFGNTSLYGDENGFIGTHGRSFAKGGELSLPYMDDALATAIENLDPGEAHLMLEDVLEDWAMEAFEKRLSQAKSVIRAAREKSPEKFLKDDSQWNEDVYKAFQGDGTGSDNYIQTLENVNAFSLMAGDIQTKREKRQGIR